MTWGKGRQGTQGEVNGCHGNSHVGCMHWAPPTLRPSHPFYDWHIAVASLPLSGSVLLNSLLIYYLFLYLSDLYPTFPELMQYPKQLTNT